MKIRILPVSRPPQTPESTFPNWCPQCKVMYTLRGTIFDYGTPIESRQLSCTNCDYIWFVPHSATEEQIERMLLVMFQGSDQDLPVPPDLM